jgi:hypothetical protein
MQLQFAFCNLNSCRILTGCATWTIITTATISDFSSILHSFEVIDEARRLTAAIPSPLASRRCVLRSRRC